MASGSGLTRGTVALTHRSIEALRPAEAPYRVSDQRCAGLAIRVAPSGLKTWDLAYRIRGTGQVRRLSLGRVADVTLENARERANQLASAARAGRDLLAEEQESQAAAASRVTVENLIELYVRRRVAGRLRTAERDREPIEARSCASHAAVRGGHSQTGLARAVRSMCRAGYRTGSRASPSDSRCDVSMGLVTRHRRNRPFCRIESIRRRYAGKPCAFVG